MSFGNAAEKNSGLAASASRTSTGGTAQPLLEQRVDEGRHRGALGQDDQAAEDDMTFASHGVTVLVDPMSHQYLDGAEIDFVETVMGGGFKVNNPNASGCGGCGGGCGDGEKEHAHAGGGCCSH